MSDKPRNVGLLRQIAERATVQVITDLKRHRIEKIDLEHVQKVLQKDKDWPPDRASQRELVSLTMRNLVGNPG